MKRETVEITADINTKNLIQCSICFGVYRVKTAEERKNPEIASKKKHICTGCAAKKYVH